MVKFPHTPHETQGHTWTNLLKFLSRKVTGSIVWLEADNAAFTATSDHNGALGTGCDQPGSSCLHAVGLERQRGPAPHRRDALPPARPPLANPSRSPVDLRPQLKPSKTRCVPFAERRHRRRLARGYRSAGVAGPGGPGLPAPSAPSHGSVPHERKPPPPQCSRILRRVRDGRVGGGARRSRRPSRACGSHVSAGVTCSRRSQSQRTLSRSKEAVVRDRPRPEMFSSLAPVALGVVAAAETPAAAATRRSSIRG